MLKNIDTTLLFIVKDGKILLATKKRGFGAGYYNGAGGKRQEGETIVEAMLRETMEEFSISPKNYKQIGYFEFILFYKGERVQENMHVYFASDYDGEPTESEEMKPVWFDLDKIPYENMFQDDKIWLPLALNGKLLKGNFEFDENNNLLSQYVEEVAVVPSR